MRARRTTHRAGFEWADFDRALAGVIGGLAAGITKVDRERTDRHASTSAPGWTSQPLVRVSCLGWGRVLLTDGSDGGMCALLRSRRRLCEFRHGSLCTCLHTLATRASGGRALLSTESCYPCSFALFYPRPLRPLRASASLHRSPTARQPAAHPGARPRPPLPTGPPSSPSPLLSQRSARASTKQSTPGPRPRNRSLSGANRSPGHRRPVGTPSVPTRSRSPSLATSLPHLHHPLW